MLIEKETKFISWESDDYCGHPLVHNLISNIITEKHVFSISSNYEVGCFRITRNLEEMSLLYYVRVCVNECFTIFFCRNEIYMLQNVTNILLIFTLIFYFISNVWIHLYFIFTKKYESFSRMTTELFISELFWKYLFHPMIIFS